VSGGGGFWGGYMVFYGLVGGRAALLSLGALWWVWRGGGVGRVSVGWGGRWFSLPVFRGYGAGGVWVWGVCVTESPGWSIACR